MNQPTEQRHDWVNCKGLADVKGDVRVVNSKVGNLEKWQETQNGALQDLAKTLKELRSLLDKVFVAVIASLLAIIGAGIIAFIK